MASTWRLDTPRHPRPRAVAARAGDAPARARRIAAAAPPPVDVKPGRSLRGVASPEDVVAAAVAACAPDFAAVDAVIAANVRRAQAALAGARVGAHHFGGSTGYGRGDAGRAALDAAVASILGTPAAIARPHFVSGTHAIAAALFGALRPGDELLAAAGQPYDTLEQVIGTQGSGSHQNARGIGSLADWGVSFRHVELGADGGIDYAALEDAVGPRTRVVLVQRSCGYDPRRRTLALADIQRAVETVHAAASKKHIAPRPLVLVDNCYGEFTEAAEPGAVGADLVAGSFIKGIGGTVAPCGGYVGGSPDLVLAAASRLTAPGCGTDMGAVDGHTLRLLLQGLWLAPHTVGEAVKGGRVVARALAAEGCAATPPPDAPAPFPFVTAAVLGSEARLVAFCGAVQAASPVGSFVRPTPGPAPGVGDEVIFGDGTFIDGSTGELSADGPLRPPYAVYCQGGAHWSQWVAPLERAVAALRAC